MIMEVKMKKLLLLLLICVFLPCNTCIAEVENKEVIEPMTVLKNSDIIEEKFITRRDCLVAVMKIIGVTDDLECGICTYKYFSDCYSLDFMYFEYSIMAGIAMGTEPVNDNTPAYKFKPNMCATYNDALAFIVRCFVPRSENIKEDAVEYGILKTTDSFYDNLDRYITDDEFYILLGRMLEKQCHTYVGRDIDNPQSKTYLEILKERREKGITAKGYGTVDTYRDWENIGEHIDNLSIMYESEQ